MTRLGCMFGSAFGGCCWTILQCGVQSLEVGYVVCSTGAFDGAGIVIFRLGFVVCYFWEIVLLCIWSNLIVGRSQVTLLHYQFHDE